MVNHYELLYLVGSNHTEDELAPIKNKVLDIVKKHTGEITFDENFGKKRLAYPVEKNHQGYYLICEFNLEGEKLEALDREIGLTNEVLRHLVVKQPVKTSGPAKRPTLNLDLEPRRDERPPHLPHASHPKPVMPKVEINAEAEKDKLKLEDLDEKLDEILEGDIM